MARLWVRTVTFDSISVGDQLPILVKWDTQESIDQFAELALSHESSEQSSLDPDKESAARGASGGTVVSGPAIVAYVAELLEKAFPIANILARGSRLEVRAIVPVRPDDTISFTGEVVDKRKDGSLRLVECAIIGENQEGQAVARPVAVVSL